MKPRQVLVDGETVQMDCMYDAVSLANSGFRNWSISWSFNQTIFVWENGTSWGSDTESAVFLSSLNFTTQAGNASFSGPVESALWKITECSCLVIVDDVPSLKSAPMLATVVPISKLMHQKTPFIQYYNINI